MDIDKTILAQYSTSPVLTTLIRDLARALSPDESLKLYFRTTFNVNTAEGKGLNTWGRIVGVPRSSNMVTAVGVPHLGFKGGIDPAATGFDQSSFYHGADRTTFKLSDEAYRLHIKAKAAANISNGSLAQLNMMLHMLFPKCDVRLTRIAPMHLKLVCSGKLTDYEKNLLLSGSMPPIPTGVTLEAEINGDRFFGFNSKHSSAFNNGPFSRGKKD